MLAALSSACRGCAQENDLEEQINLTCADAVD